MGESKSSKRRITAAMKQAEACKLRLKGWTFEAIAAEVGYRGPSGAYKAVMAALNATLQEPADSVRTMEVERLDAMLFSIWEGVESGDERAIDRALRIMERRAKLLGLDAPAKVAQTDPDGAALAPPNIVVYLPAGPRFGAPEEEVGSDS